ncbi:AP-2 complex subunit alpha [Vairimorpha necatrix]|uniref:AP-2 complex subunit alpha n=1 Tax=Vairimorpha necatrix TaxID=6039 RepID=A0AAX4J8V2_9MICR
MPLTKNTSLSIFISELRTLDKEAATKKIFVEQRKLYSEKNMNYSKILTLIYFVINKYNIDPMMFVNASASEDYNVKRAGYLGLTLCKNNNLLILTVNTVMKDLKSHKNRELALDFLCNINVKEKIYDDLSDYICISSSNDKNITKGIIAKSRISNLNTFSLVGNSDDLIFVKLQILHDKMCRKEDVKISDNDILFIIAIYSTVKSSYLKLKLIQIYKLLFSEQKLFSSDTFILEIQNDIISPSDTIKPLVEIGLSAEICDLLILMGHKSSKVEHFLCRLIDSKNTNSRYIGFKIARKYNLFTDKLINRSIKIGINVKYVFETIIKLINKNNYKDIFRRKEEMRFVMDKNLVEYTKSNDLIIEILIRILKFANEDFIVKMYYVHPEIAFKKDVKSVLSEKYRRDLFSKIINSPSISSIYLFYSLLPKNFDDKKLLEELFSFHLNILTSKKYNQKILTLEKMIFTICKFENIDFFRDALKDKYIELYKSNSFTDILFIILNGIFLMNPRSKEKVFHITDHHFISYVIFDKLLRLKVTPEIKLVNILDDKAKINDNDLTVDFNMTNLSKLTFKVQIDGKFYTKSIKI